MCLLNTSCFRTIINIYAWFAYQGLSNYRHYTVGHLAHVERHTKLSVIITNIYTPTTICIPVQMPTLLFILRFVHVTIIDQGSNTVGAGGEGIALHIIRTGYHCRYNGVLRTLYYNSYCKFIVFFYYY